MRDPKTKSAEHGSYDSLSKSVTTPGRKPHATSSREWHVAVCSRGQTVQVPAEKLLWVVAIGLRSCHESG